MDRAALADAVLAVHFAFALFVVAGFVAILLGAWLGWRWVRGRAFRLAHLGAIVLVALEAVLGLACPLTVLEDALRGTSPASNFVARWLGKLLYYDFPGWVFTVSYVALAALAAWAWRRIPPLPRGASRRAAAGG